MSPQRTVPPASSRRRSTGYVSGQATRVRLIEAAEALFADRGIDAVSLNEVRIAAGQSNAAAVNYHFGSKEQLVKAVLDHRVVRIEADRGEMLGALEDRGEIQDPRGLLEALVHPQAGSIERGERYVGFAARLLLGELGGYSDYIVLLADSELTPHGHRIDQLLRAGLADLPTAVVERRMVFLYTSAMLALAQHQRAKQAGVAPPTPRYVAELIDMLVAILQAPGRPQKS